MCISKQGYFRVGRAKRRRRPSKCQKAVIGDFYAIPKKIPDFDGNSQENLFLKMNFSQFNFPDFDNPPFFCYEKSFSHQTNEKDF